MTDLPHLSGLQARIGFQFSSESLLRHALTHKSFVNENKTLNVGDNERLEFLGDAVLDLVISEILYTLFPDLKEGPLSKKRASIVREESLAAIAREIGLGEYILLGKGELLSGGRDKSSLLADTFEALVAALYLDGGLEKAKEVIEEIFIPLIKSPLHFADFKSELQELCQKEKRGPIAYEVASESGPDHDKTFEVVLHIEGKPVARGRGKSIKEAEQMAARRALKEAADHG
ncbi:MAG: ribonuclease III [Deltaproteobacteria bacterium]|nr:ribonuclease III [Deltaproteobacteria bacterium]